MLAPKALTVVATVSKRNCVVLFPLTVPVPKIVVPVAPILTFVVDPTAPPVPRLIVLVTPVPVAPVLMFIVLAAVLS